MSVISKMTFDNGSTKNLISSTFYGRCDTAAATAAKTVTIGGWDESVKDNISGSTIHILFSNSSTAANPTLNVDNQGAHPIYIEEDVKASSFPAGIYALTLTQLTISSQETWCWVMSAKAISANYATSAGSATSASSVPWNGVTNPPATYTPTSHSHGNIDNSGTISATATATNGDTIIISDSSASGALVKGPTFGNATDTYLRNNGTWATPSAGVTSVTIKGTSPISVSSEAAITTTGERTISLTTAYGDTQNPYGSKTANTVLAAPNGSAGNPTFRALVAADIPSLTKSKISDFPTNVSAFTNDAGYVTTNTTYTLSTGDSNGQIKVTPSVGDAYNVDVKGLGSNAYTSTEYLPTTGGNVTGDIVLLKQVSSGAPGDSYGITFQRGTLTDNYNDWRIVDSGGYLHFYERGSGSTSWNDRVIFNTTGNVSATSFTGSGASLTSLNASNLSSGTVPIARLPDLSSTYIPVSQKGAASGVAELDSNSKLPVVQSNYLYGKCSTAAGTVAKVVTIAGYSETTIAAMEGVTVFVAFAYTNTASSPTLNVSGSGAHPIVAGTYQDPANVGRFSNGLHSFTLVKASDNNYYWWINEGRDTVPEAPTTAGTYLLTINSSGNVSWSSYTPPTAATTGTVTIGASGWSGNGPYSHAVTISGTTTNSKIDLQPDSTVLAQMTTDGTTALYIENNNGTLTAYAMGNAPTAALSIQYTKTEVS